MAVITYGGNTDTKSHNKRNRHGARRHTSGIEGHRQKALWNKQRKEECQYVKCNQHVGQRYAEQHAQKCNDEKYAHSQRDRKNQRPVRYGWHLFRQYLEIRFRNRDDESQYKSQYHDDAQLFTPRDGCAQPLSHGSHADLRPQREEHGTYDDHGRAHKEAQQNTGGNGSDRKTQDHDDPDDREHGMQRFRQFLSQFQQGIFQ